MKPVCFPTAAVIGSVCLAVAACGRTDAPSPASMGAAPRPVAYIGPIPGPQLASRLPEPTNPFASDSQATQDGRRLFVRYNCSGCHGGHAGGGMGPSLRDTTWIYGDSAGHIFSSISEGRANGMPAWGSLLPQDQIWKLVSYVRSLGTSSEAAPPNPAPASASPDAAEPVT